MTDEAAALFEKWWIKNGEECKTRTGKLDSAWSKMSGHLLRLSLVLEHLWWTAPGQDTGRPRLPPQEIGQAAVAGAIRLMDEYFGPMAERVYGCSGPTLKVRSAAVIAQHIVATQATRLNARELCRKRVLGTQESAPVMAALSELVEAGWLKQIIPETERKLPRPRADYLVNPEVLQMLSSSTTLSKTPTPL